LKNGYAKKRKYPTGLMGVLKSKETDITDKHYLRTSKSY